MSLTILEKIDNLYMKNDFSNLEIELYCTVTHVQRLVEEARMINESNLRKIYF